MTGLELRLDPLVRNAVRVGWIRAEPVRVAPAALALRAEIDRVLGDLVRRNAGRAPAQIEALAPARELYRSFGIDPTRTRPSSEALLRRAQRGLPFPAISNAVDVGNLCSVLFLLPIGLYDTSAIEGPVTLRRGLPGESYPGIRKDDVHLEGRPVLCDARRPFGNPTSDSAHAAVSDRTRSLWMTVFAPRSFPVDLLGAHTGTAAELMARHLAGTAPVDTARGITE